MSNSPRWRALGLAWLAFVACAAPSAGQTTPKTDPCLPLPTDAERARCYKDTVRTETERLLREDIQRESQAIYPYALAGTMPTAVKLVASSDNKTAALTYAIPLNALSSLTLTVTAPLSDSDPRTSILQVSGLANKGTVGARWTWGLQRRPVESEADRILTRILGVCRTAGATTSSKPGSGITEEGCDTTTLGRRRPEIRAELDQYQRTAWFATLSGQIGRQSFAWLDSTTFGDGKDTKHPASGAFAVGALVAPWNVFASLGARLENGYADRDKQAVCAPGQSGQRQACPLNVVGAPKNTRRGVAELEVRKFLDTNPKHPVGLSTLVRWDWMHGDTSVEIPLYLVQDKDGGLSGGISTGYAWSSTPENRGARLVVFVGQTFGLVPTRK